MVVRHCRLSHSADLLLGLDPGSASYARSTRTETISAEAAAAGTILEGRPKGDGTAEQVIDGQSSKMQLVDLPASNASPYFNIPPEGRQEALSAGSGTSVSCTRSGADIPGEGCAGLPRPTERSCMVCELPEAAI
jgi:hypothetical protein